MRGTLSVGSASYFKQLRVVTCQITRHILKAQIAATFENALADFVNMLGKRHELKRRACAKRLRA